MRGRLGVAGLSLFAAVFYFSEGFPYGVVNELLPLYLRSEGVSLSQIGFLSLVRLAWTLKFFWSPLVDAYGSYQRWITAALGGITLALALFALTPLVGTAAFWWVAALLAASSATQDVAVDAFTIAATEKKWLGIVNSIRVTTYRLGMIAAGGGLAAIADRLGWPSAFGTAAAVAAILMVLALLLPREERPEAARVGVIGGLRIWLAQPKAGVLLAIALLYKLGDSSLNPMVRPFWIDRGFSLTEIGLAISTVGLGATIVGAWIAGVAIARRGLYRCMIWFGVAQIASNAVYALIAASTARSVEILYTGSIVESLTYGLGTGTFLAFLMAICDRERAATEFALLSALFGLSASLAGSVSGVITDALGYVPYFWITVALGVPGLLLVPIVRERLEAAAVEPPSPGQV
ncbi:MAG TPA: MFS transporter [Thermoanaerobaculia bacterium]|nr:MFS transporter [Thermoanaerobaculia bacterium]